MQRSESVAELVKALSAAQAEIIGAVKESKNTHFDSKYANLSAVWDAVRGPLTKHGLSVVQFPRASELGVEVETTLFHLSGQFLSDTLAMPVRQRDAHGFASGITYARRIGLMAIAGVAAVDDDDGNGATGKDAGGKGAPPPPPPPRQVKTATPTVVPPPPPAPTKLWTDSAIKALAGMRTAKMVADWQQAQAAAIDKLATKSPADHTRLIDTINERLDALRPQAAE